MLPLASAEVFAGLIALFLLVLPLGLILIRAAERFLLRRLALSLPERLLLSFYAAGGLFFVLASIPLPIYGLPLVVGALAAGVIGFALVTFYDRGAALRGALAIATRWPLVALGAGSLALLVLEVTNGLVPLPNGIDGTVYSLFVNLTLRNHSLPWTLAPYSSDGVVYPQGAPVWMTLPVLLFNWPIVSVPVNLPPLFLSFSAAAAFCLGERLAPVRQSNVPWMGLLFAGCFGALLSWPRLYVAGSYDFIFALPLFLLILGFLAPHGGLRLGSWRDTVALGALIGVVSILSATIGVALVVLLAAYLLVSRPVGRGSFLAVAGRFVTVVGVALLFVGRSIVALAVWFNDPGHVRVDAGSPPYYLPAHAQNYTGVIGMLDPFVPWKGKISPIPPLSLEIQLLLAAGLIVAFLSVVPSSAGRAFRRYLPAPLVTWVLVGTIAMFLETSVILILQALNTTLSGIQSVVNLWETSILLFTYFGLVAILPVIAALNYLLQQPRSTRSNSSALDDRRRWRLEHSDNGRPLRRGVQLVAILLLVVPLGTGLGFTIEDVPGYLHSAIQAQGNGTAADIAALEWAAGHLPSCSRVLVPPGSAAQFLPEYAVVTLVFPVYPPPTNLSYSIIVSNLTAGVYDNTTRSAFVSLDVTELFATGQTTNADPPFRVAELQHSSDFDLLFEDQDAEIYSFLPGVAATGCVPT
jgi:hypothetical protein